jgi:hypothetical protein
MRSPAVAAAGVPRVVDDEVVCAGGAGHEVFEGLVPEEDAVVGGRGKGIATAGIVVVVGVVGGNVVVGCNVGSFLAVVVRTCADERVFGNIMESATVRLSDVVRILGG